MAKDQLIYLHTTKEQHMTNLEMAKQNINKRIDYFTKEAIKQGYGERISQNTMNYVYGLKEALEMIEWAELESDV